MTNSGSEEAALLQKLHSETAKISWLELQRFFAKGVVMKLDSNLDLLEVAMLFAQDESSQLKCLIDSKSVMAPSNEQARDWFEREVDLWSVVVAPFVLVQEKD